MRATVEAALQRQRSLLEGPVSQAGGLKNETSSKILPYLHVYLGMSIDSAGNGTTETGFSLRLLSKRDRPTTIIPSHHIDRRATVTNIPSLQTYRYLGAKADAIPAMARFQFGKPATDKPRMNGWMRAQSKSPTRPPVISRRGELTWKCK